MSSSDDDEKGIEERLAAQGEIVRRHRDQQIALAERQAGVLARSAEVHEELARVHETLATRFQRITPQQARDHAALDRERSAEETRHAEHARDRREQEDRGRAARGDADSADRGDAERDPQQRA